MAYDEYRTKPFQDIAEADEILHQVGRELENIPTEKIPRAERLAYATARAQLAHAKMLGRTRV
jgi:hypothetical protein